MILARELLTDLGTYKHGQMDQCVVDKCNELAIKEDLSAEDVKKLLDECAFSSLCTDLVMITLIIVWQDLLKDESKDNDSKKTL